MSTINKLGPDGRWYYNPIVDITNPDHRAVMFAVKLHKHASICYRYEIFDQQISAASDAISLLAFNSNDLRYPGYPYGLIDADAFARISEREQKYQQTMFAMLRSQMASVNAGDAHDVINRIVG
jgi:hypothetical protein